MNIVKEFSERKTLIGKCDSEQQMLGTGGTVLQQDKDMPCSERYNALEYHCSWWGAVLLAKRLIELLADKSKYNIYAKAKNTTNLLNFLLKSKSDMLNFIYHDNVFVKSNPIKDKKGKVKEYAPYRVIWESGTPNKVANELDFISPQENRWRDTAKILMNALNNACTIIGVLTGRKPNDIFNELLCGKEIEKEEQL